MGDDQLAARAPIDRAEAFPRPGRNVLLDKIDDQALWVDPIFADHLSVLVRLRLLLYHVQRGLDLFPQTETRRLDVRPPVRKPVDGIGPPDEDEIAFSRSDEDD